MLNYGTPPLHNQPLSYDHLITCDEMVTYDICTGEWVKWEQLVMNYFFTLKIVPVSPHVDLNISI